LNIKNYISVEFICNYYFKVLGRDVVSGNRPTVYFLWPISLLQLINNCFFPFDFFSFLSLQSLTSDIRVNDYVRRVINS